MTSRNYGHNKNYGPLFSLFYGWSSSSIITKSLFTTQYGGYSILVHIFMAVQKKISFNLKTLFVIIDFWIESNGQLYLLLRKQRSCDQGNLCRTL